MFCVSCVIAELGPHNFTEQSLIWYCDLVNHDIAYIIGYKMSFFEQDKHTITVLRQHKLYRAKRLLKCLEIKNGC